MKREAIFILSLFLFLSFVGCSSSKEVKFRAWDLMEEGKHQKALELVDQEAIENYPEDERGDLFHVRGDAYRALENYDEAMKEYQKALKHDSFSHSKADTHFGIGQIHMKREDYDKAIESFSTALSWDSSNRAALKFRARAKKAMGDQEGYEKDMKRLSKKTEESSSSSGTSSSSASSSAIGSSSDSGSSSASSSDSESGSNDQDSGKQEDRMEDWEEETNGAPRRDYEAPAVGLSYDYEGMSTSAPSTAVNARAGYGSCEGTKFDSRMDTFKDIVKKIKKNVGSNVELHEKKEDTNNYDWDYEVTWKITWWFKSHPRIKFHGYLTFDMRDCSELRKYMEEKYKDGGEDIKTEKIILTNDRVDQSGHWPKKHHEHGWYPKYYK